MKKRIFQEASIGFLCLALGFPALAQTAVSPAPPPPPPAAKTATAPDRSEQKEIIIKQKGDKDTKITLEIKNGELFINGKPSDKFDDSDIIIEKRVLDEDVQEIPELSYSPSPFRDQALNNAARAYQQAEMDKVRSDLDMQRKIQKSMQIRMNEAFLGVSSRKTEKAGAAVLEVTQGSPAEKAGIKKGDLITKVNDAKIDGPETLFETIRSYKPGDKVKIVLIRDGKEQTVTATLEKSEQTMPKDFNYNYRYNFKMPPMPDMSDMGGMRILWEKAPKLGIKAQDAEDGKGVNILEVEDSSAAAKAGLKKGDVILQFDGKTVNSTNELIDQLQDARQKPQVMVKIQRGAVTREIQLKIPRKLKTAEL